MATSFVVVAVGMLCVFAAAAPFEGSLLQQRRADTAPHKEGGGPRKRSHRVPAEEDVEAEEPHQEVLELREEKQDAASARGEEINFLKENKGAAAGQRRAAATGDIPLIEWLLAEGCPVNAGACTEAAEAQQFDMLRKLRELGVPWSAGGDR